MKAMTMESEGCSCGLQSKPVPVPSFPSSSLTPIGLSTGAGPFSCKTGNGGIGVVVRI